MNSMTHKNINQELCGTPVLIKEGSSIVRLRTTDHMAADEEGLVHGGFVFGMADYAAMLAVNDPYVVLGSAETKFLKPVTVGEELEAHATIEENVGKKRRVAVSVFCGETKVLSGVFVCFLLEQHVLKIQK